MNNPLENQTLAERLKVQAEVHQICLDSLQRADKQLTKAKAAYTQALIRCAENGIPNTVIARKVGRTETAIRTYLKRKGFHRD